MINLLKTTFFILLAINLLACTSDSMTADGSNNAQNASTTVNTSTPIGKVIGYRDNVISLEGQDPIRLDHDTSSVIAIVLRPAETYPTRQSITPEGQMRAEKLSHTFVLCGIEQIYAEGNAALQTAQLVARSNYCNLGVMQDDGTDLLAKMLIKNWKGKKLMVIGNATMMTNAIGSLAGPGKHVVPKDEYDHVFIVRARSLGDADVYHFKY